MCPFALKLSSLLLNNAKFGAYRIDTITAISENATKWQAQYDSGPYDYKRTSARIALAALCTTNAVLGRPTTPRTVQQMVDGLREKVDFLACLKTEQEIMKGWSDDGQTGHVLRAQKALELAIDLEMFLAGVQTQRDDVQKVFSERAADDYFAFSQRECTKQGQGMDGLGRAVGIVIGEVSIEEVVFG